MPMGISSWNYFRFVHSYILLLVGVESRASLVSWQMKGHWCSSIHKETMYNILEYEVCLIHFTFVSSFHICMIWDLELKALPWITEVRTFYSLRAGEQFWVDVWDIFRNIINFSQSKSEWKWFFNPFFFLNKLHILHE